MNQQTSSSKIQSIEMLRGIAAFLVAWYHFTQGNHQFLSDGWLKSSGVWGWLGVEMFFVISGFVIPFALYKGQFIFSTDWYRFLLKRITRIDPPYLVSIGLVAGLWYLSALTPGFQGLAPDISWYQVAVHLGYLTDFLGMNWLQPVYWSLAIEFQYYFLIMLVIPLLIHQNLTIRRMAILVLILIPVIGFSKILVFYWLALFGIGITGFLFYTGLLNRVEFSVFLSLSSLICAWRIGIPETIAGLLTLWLIFLLKNVSIRPLLFMGTISYSLYLVHVPVGGRIINLFTRLDDSLWIHLAGLLAASAVSILFSWMFYHLAEKPSIRLASRITY